MLDLGNDIPKLGFGLMRLPKIGEEIDIEQTKQMVDAFLEAGGRYFDTARAYGSSEAAIRQALVERYPRENYLLATKAAAWRYPEDAEEARRSIQVSLEETGAGYFDFFLLHNLGDSRTRYFDDYSMWELAQQLKAEGIVRHVGFSLHDNADVLDQLLREHPEMEFVQLQVNYADWENGNVQSKRCLDVAAKHGKPVIIMEPVRGGTLATPPKPVAEILLDANPNASFASWAMRFCLDLPNVITVLSGASTLEQLQENIEIWKEHQPLNASEHAALRAAQSKLEEITEVSCTACHYCMDDCPVNLDIANIMAALNRSAMYGTEHGKGWYEFATNGHAKASECLACGNCESACPQHLPIIEKMKKMAALYD